MNLKRSLGYLIKKVRYECDGPVTTIVTRYLVTEDRYSLCFSLRKNALARDYQISGNVNRVGVVLLSLVSLVVMVRLAYVEVLFFVVHTECPQYLG